MRQILCFNALSRFTWQNNERQSLFDKEFVNREKWGPTPNKRVSEQEVDSVKFKASAWKLQLRVNRSAWSQAEAVAVMTADNI